jgi:hypothetical protein
MRPINYNRLRVASCLLLAACGFNPPAGPDGGGDDIDAPPANLPTVGFEVASSGADEMTPSVTVSVVLSAAAEAPVSVSYAVAGGSATPGTDFTVSGDLLTFAVGETRKEVPIAIVADADEAEPSETIDLVLSAPTGATLDANPNHTITISNLILPRVQFMTVTTTTAEGTQTQVAVTLDKAAAGPSSVVLGIAGGTATPSADFAVTDGTTIDIAPNATTAMVDIGEINDLLDEENETVVFSLRSPSSNLAIGNLSMSTHTITDNDNPPVLEFAQAAANANEDAGTATITVTLDAPSGKTVTVDYSGNAASAADATVVGTTVTFAPGDVSETIDVTLVNDTLDEDDESVVVTLANPDNASIGPSSTHTLTIKDDDAAPSVSFSASATSRNEANATLNLTITLSTASGKTVTVPFTRGGTATDGADYTITGTSRTITPGNTTANIGVTMIEDTTDEDDQTVIVTLVATPEASLGATPAHTLTIADDDNAPNVSWDVASRSVAEGNPSPNFTAFTFNLVLSAASEKTIIVPFALSGDALDPDDYTVQTSSPVTFAPGATTAAVNYRVVRDATAEDDDDIIFTINPNPTNASRGSPSNAVHTITDDDN